MKKTLKYLRKAVAWVLFVCAMPFAFVAAAFYFVINELNPPK